MAVEHFRDPKAFARKASDWLEADEAVNNLPLGLLGVLERNPELAASALMLALQQDLARLVAVRTPPKHLVLGQTPGALELMPELVAWLVQHQPDLSGLVAPLELARAFAPAWEAATGRVARLEMEERLYQLRQVIPPQWPPGRYRKALIGDLGTLLGWTEAFLSEALPHEKHDSERLRQSTLKQIEAGALGVWEVKDRLVSMAARTRPTRRGCAVTLVYTPPEQRGRGYASASVAALSQSMLAEGKAFCCLFTDLSNPTSNTIYQRIGYQPIADVLMLSFGKNG
ncbi:MAG TPA: GNAT family N-acetyltransferase [Candidatus Obscuribacterales bacterium]